MAKTVLITGASRGIGAACAELFAKAHYNVVINYLNSEEKANSLSHTLNSKGYNTMVYKADVSQYDMVDRMITDIVDTYGGVDVLVNNAAISEHKLLFDMTFEDWQRMINVNLNSCFNTTRLTLPHMLNNKCGKIINVSSIWGIKGASMEAHYSAAKAGIIGLTKSLALEYAPSNIQVNCVAPGVINTDMNSNLNDEEMQSVIKDIPLMRLGKSEEIAEMILYLASDKADYITGQIITIDGGYSIG